MSTPLSNELPLGFIQNIEDPSTTELCTEPIYDDFMPTEDPDLLAVIAKFASQDVQVHVQLVRKPALDGYTITNQAEGDAYRAAVMSECGWVTSNHITIMVVGDIEVDEPHYFNIALSGEQEKFQEEHSEEVSEVKTEFKNDLVEGSAGTYEQDVADALTLLYEKEFTAQTPVPVQMPETAVIPKQPERSIDIPVVPLASGAMTVAVSAAMAARIMRGRSIKQEKTGFETTSLANAELVTNAYLEANSNVGLTSIIPEGDAERLRELEQKVKNGQYDWETLLLSTRTIVSAQRRKLWPNKYVVQESIQTYHESSGDYLEIVTQYNEERAAVQQRLNEVDEMGAAVRNLALAAVEAVGAHKAPNESTGDVIHVGSETTIKYYDVTLLEEKIAAAQAKLAQAEELQAQRFVDKPHALFRQATEAFIEVQSFVEALPEYHARIIQDAETNAAEQENRQLSLRELERLVQEIKQTYDASCWADIDGLLQAATEKYGSVASILTSIGNPSEEFNIAALESDKNNLSKITDLEAEFEGAETALHKHKSHLDNLRDTLPGEIGQLLESQTSYEKYVKENDVDVEDPTEQELFVLRSSVEALMKKISEDGKPAYLQLKKMQQELGTKQELAYNKATAEKQEMDSLRSEVESLRVECEDLITQAVLYERTHQDVDNASEEEIRNLELPEEPRARSRVALREAVRSYKISIELFNDAIANAKQDVKRVEDANETARRAEIARLEAIAAAERRRKEAEERREREEREERDRRNATVDISDMFKGGSGTKDNSGMF